VCSAFEQAGWYNQHQYPVNKNDNFQVQFQGVHRAKEIDTHEESRHTDNLRDAGAGGPQ
jgi:hypothetical protein